MNEVYFVSWTGFALCANYLECLTIGSTVIDATGQNTEVDSVAPGKNMNEVYVVSCTCCALCANSLECMTSGITSAKSQR